jgi:hypothetical protein
MTRRITIVTVVLFGCTKLTGDPRFYSADATLDRVDVVTDTGTETSVMVPPCPALTTGGISETLVQRSIVNLPEYFRARAGVAHPDGSFTMTGSIEPPPGSAANQRDILLFQITPSLMIDTTRFDAPGGVVRTPVPYNGGNGTAISNTVVLAPDGGFVVAGFLDARPPYATVGFVARFDGRGHLLTEFGNGGIVLHRPVSPTPAEGGIAWLHVYTDEAGIVVVGTDRNPTITPVTGRYTRLRWDGSTDPTFADGTLQSDTRFRSFGAIMRDGDGYVMAGDTRVGSRPALLFLDRNGTPRADRGTAGLVVHSVDAAQNFYVRSLAGDSLGGWIVAGGRGPFANFRVEPAAVRFGPEGTTDPTFARTGVFVSETLSVWWWQEVFNGGFVADGADRFSLLYSEQESNVVTERIDRCGMLDPTFGAGGTIRGARTNNVWIVLATWSLPDGSRVVANERNDYRSIDLQRFAARSSP